MYTHIINMIYNMIHNAILYIYIYTYTYIHILPGVSISEVDVGAPGRNGDRGGGAGPKVALSGMGGVGPDLQVLKVSW